jgi:hypothetical protein
MKLIASLPYTSAEGGRATQSVTAGMRQTAQDAFDNVSDTKALGSAIVSAYAYHPEFTPKHQFLAQDIRADHYPQSWTLYLSSNQDGQPVTLNWALPAATPGDCRGVTLSLTDVTAGTTVDLLQGSYAYTNRAATPRLFTLTATSAAQSAPAAPLNLFSPRRASTSVLLAWSEVTDSAVVGYQVYRKDPGTTGYVRRTASPAPSAKYLDSDLVPGGYAYFVTAVTATGCESPPSTALTVTVKSTTRRSHHFLKLSDHHRNNQ